jgi:hypothetical protein
MQAPPFSLVVVGVYQSFYRCCYCCSLPSSSSHLTHQLNHSLLQEYGVMLVYSFQTKIMRKE